MRHIKITFLFFFIFTFLIACDKNEPTDNNNTPVIKGPLKVASPYPIGAAINISELKNNSSYNTLLKEEFNSLTAENVMKMATLSTGKDKYNWVDADFIIDYSLSNNMRVHGHCLVWHRSVPFWLNTYAGTKEDWKNLMKDYISAVVTRYKGKVASWDVVNEALLDNGTPRSESIWYQKIGWEYVELAFRFAHEADPDAVLFYNDYGQEYSSVKLKAINDTVRNMINRGVPIHGIGLQMHTHINHPTNLMSNAINQSALVAPDNGMKLKIHVSELDVALNPSKTVTYALNATDLDLQKARYRTIAATMRALPKEQCWGITTWGVTDNNSWLRSNPDYPLIFDSEYKPKPCYTGIIEAFSIK